MKCIVISESDCNSGETDTPGRVSNKQPHLKGERGRTHIPFYTCFMANLVKVVCGDAWLELRSGDVQNLPSQSTNLAHRILTLGVQKIYLESIEAILARWYSCLGPVWVFYGFGEGTPGGKRIDGPHGTGKGKCWEWIVQSGD